MRCELRRFFLSRSTAMLAPGWLPGMPTTNADELLLALGVKLKLNMAQPRCTGEGSPESEETKVVGGRSEVQVAIMLNDGF